MKTATLAVLTVAAWLESGSSWLTVAFALAATVGAIWHALEPESRP